MENTDLKDPSTSSDFVFEISETGDPIPFELIKVDEGGKEYFVISMEQPHVNTEISPRNVNIAEDSNQPTTATCTSNEKLPNRPAKTMKIGSSGDATDFPDEHDSYFFNDDSSSHGSSSDEEPTGMTSLKEAWSSELLTMRFELKTPQNLFVSPPRIPYEAFRWFLSDDLLDQIVRETNKFAARLRIATNGSKKVQCSTWTDLTRKELLTFLGLLLHTGTVRMDNLHDYWKAEYLVNFGAFSKFMLRDRFLDISKSLSFTPAETVSSSDDIFANFRPIVDNFNKTMKEIYYPRKQLILASLKTSDGGKNKTKKTLKNIFSLILAESNGIVLKYQLNSESNMVNTDKYILDLIEGLDAGHVIYVEKSLSSHKLAHELLHRQTYCTVEINKPDKDKMLNLSAHRIHGQKNRSTKRKYYMTTEFGGVILFSSHHKDEFGSIANYSKYMTSKKLVDALSSYHPSYRNTLRSHQRLFVQALQIYINNAFNLFNLYGPGTNISLFNFRKSILECLLPSSDMLGRPSSVGQPGSRLHTLMETTRTKIRKRKKLSQGEQCEECRRSAFRCTGCPDCPPICVECYCEKHAYYSNVRK